MTNIHQRIRELRNALGMTQPQFSEMLGISGPRVSRWETVHVPPDRQLERIAYLFGVNLEWLKSGKGKMFLHDKPVFREEEDNIASRLKELRTALKLTQPQFAEKLGLKTYTNITNWEKTGLIPKAKRLLICKTCGASLEWLETGEGEMFDATVEPFVAPREYALRNGCDEVTATIFERFIKLPAKEKKEFSRILTQIASGASSEPAYQVSQDDLTAENVEGSIVLKGHVNSRDITVNNYGK